VYELRLEHDDVSLCATDFGGRGPPVVLLHGLAGYAGEWAETASWLRERHRVVALDQRGHGASSRVPPTVEPGAFVGDVLEWLDRLGLERTSLVGQSFGGLIAFLTAAAQPERVQRLVVAEASPSPDPGAEPEARAWLDSWPVPFPEEESAVRFFGGDSVRARAWAGGLDAREDGLWPRFDRNTLLQALRESSSDHWDAWSSIRSPVLIVRGEHAMAADEAHAMAAQLKDAVLATVAGAGHDVHLEQPVEWRRVVEPFLAPNGG
jgi:pimeloyl-ACP methyl ester carboxylesterase